MAVSLDFIQSQLKAIQADVREFKFAAEVDRRNVASLYNNLAAEFGAAIGKLDAKVELGFEAVNERIDQLETRIDRLETRIGGLETRTGGLETRIGGLEMRIGGLETGIGGLETRIDRLETGIDRLETTVNGGFARIEQLLKKD